MGIEEPETVSCPAAGILIQAPDTLKLVRLENREIRASIAEQLALDSCLDRRFALELPIPVALDEKLRITRVRCRMEFDCGVIHTRLRHETWFSILINRRGDFLVNGEIATLEQLLVSFDRAIHAKEDGDYPLTVVLDWQQCPAGTIESLLTELVQRYWLSTQEGARKRGGASLCDMSEEQVTSLLGEYVFQLRLLPSHPPPPPIGRRINAPTIFIEKDVSRRDSLD